MPVVATLFPAATPLLGKPAAQDTYPAPESRLSRHHGTFPFRSVIPLHEG